MVENMDIAQEILEYMPSAVNDNASTAIEHESPNSFKKGSSMFFFFF